VGRDDGGVELHSFELNPDGEPVKAWRGDVNEFVTSLEHGLITNSDREEMCLCTYSGKILSFSPHAADPTVPTALSAAPAPLPPSVSSGLPVRDASDDSVSIARAKMAETQLEIKQLEEQLQKRKTEYAQLTGETAAGMKAVAATFSVAQRLFLNDQGVATLSVELDTNMESAAISTELDVELMDQSGGDILVSQTSRELVSQSRYKVLALYRSTTSCTRLEVHFRPSEGNAGDVNVIVAARGSPKTAQQCVFYVPPLCLHRRLQTDLTTAQAASADVTMSLLTMKGPFSAKQVHSWLFKTLFDVPEILTRTEGTTTLMYEHTYAGTLLIVEYQAGAIALRSQNISALVLARNFLSRQATEAKVQLHIDLQVQPPSVARMLEFLHPKLERLTKLSRSVALLEALREIEQQEPDVGTFLSEDFKHTLQHGKEMESEFRDHAKGVAFAEKVLVTLLMDVATSIGQAVSPVQVEQLRKIVANYNQRDLVDFFNQL